MRVMDTALSAGTFPFDGTHSGGKSMTADERRADIPWQSQTEDGQVLLSTPWEIFVLGTIRAHAEGAGVEHAHPRRLDAM